MKTNHNYYTLFSRLPSRLAWDAPQHWADLGCGNGVFTEVLAAYLPVHSRITAVDRTYQQLPAIMGNEVSVSFQQADFVAGELGLQSLQGILLANALHFVKDKEALIQKLEKYFAAQPSFLIVEYDHTIANQWVPYPVPFQKLKKHFAEYGYQHIEKIGERKSMYGGRMYAAVITGKTA
ncbi:class I SAM-dependent methyltransferase [Parapedobacter lycopersici]|uniref:class I SAM-dependent methyltransferase n=1 Tax=Parapedobacter lycopersici TaxID=1864939 RepID=UPI003342B713